MYSQHLEVRVVSFFNIASKNVRKNINNYTTYFVSAVFSVMVLYVFLSIAFNKDFVEQSEHSMKVKVAFEASAIIIALFSAIFIWYSNSFFIKKRKKEMAIYSILGMTKKNIARILFYENMVIGAFSIICGIFFGMLFSKFFSMMLVNLMKEAVTIRFVIVPKAAIISIFLFVIIFIITSVHSYSVIYRFKLIDLFMSQKEGEKPPKVSYFVGLLSIILILIGYFLVTGKTSMEIVKYALPVLILECVGTFLLFNSFIIMLIKLIKDNKSYYYKGTNMIGTSQILYRIKGNAKTLTIIAILSAVTLTAVGTAYSFYKTTEADLNSDYPASYEYINLDKKVTQGIESTIEKYKDNNLISKSSLKIIKGAINLQAYRKGDFDGYIISEKQYNDAIKAKNRGKSISLKNNECFFIERNQGDGKDRKLDGKTVKVSANGTSKNLKISKASNIQVLYVLMSQGTVVVSNDVYDEFYKTSEAGISIITNYTVKNDYKAKALTEELNKIVPKQMSIMTYYENYNGYYKSSGSIMFIGVFLGVLFFLATGSIIYFKQIMEANDDKDRYLTLRNIGVSTKEIKVSVAKQLVIVFLLPLLIAICHSTVALLILQKLLAEKIMIYCIQMFVVYIIMYVIYYIITVNSYTKIVSGKR